MTDLWSFLLQTLTASGAAALVLAVQPLRAETQQGRWVVLPQGDFRTVTSSNVSLSNAAWGYFFLNFDFNLGTVSIFPRFVGFQLFLSAIKTLSGERRDLALLPPYVSYWRCFQAESAGDSKL